eukprot:CAMPEP_0197557644 /NCGR_PEP_ID=MMETSP1320-20131121/17501_1 /TAXON_ID=91990 /ORGANISM="Bolidomonas sp., Strain RCC2347" /LENGTH=548 /DNA_ID=CAMNT_0043118895 /DNA_START=126 /DNA_END=1768 /DNA_ORIENTATION=+
MATFSTYERIHQYSGPISSSTPRSRKKSVTLQDDADETSSEDPGNYDKSSFHRRRSKQPKNASLCYVMSGGGVSLKGDTTTNGGKIRLREHDRMNDENLRTHDRLSKIESTIPKARKSKKPTGVVATSFEMKQRREKQKLAVQNQKLTKALNGIYKGKARLSSHGVKRKDCRRIWSKRTGIYDMENKQAPANTGVPKTAAMVCCGGCGLKTFYGADGLTVHQGVHGNMDDGHLVYYCNDVCAAVDWELNRENINKQDTSGKGRKPLRKANYWVQSMAATKARKMLRAAVDRGELPDLDRIMHEIKVQRQLGKTQSAAIARTLPGNDEENKDNVLTGTQKAKRHIIQGAAYYEKLDSYPEPDIWHGAEPPRGTYKEQVAREKACRYLEDVREVERIVREGSNRPKGSVDKNAPSKPAPEKKVNPNKYKGGSKLSLVAEPGSGADFDDKKEMYKSSAALQREADAKAKKIADEGQRRANRNRANKRQQESKAEYDSYNDTEGKREGKFNIKTRTASKPPKRVSFVERPADFNGIKYDATQNKRNEERGIA